jgi:hypothetical protein
MPDRAVATDKSNRHACSRVQPTQQPTATDKMCISPGQGNRHAQIAVSVAATDKQPPPFRGRTVGCWLGCAYVGRRKSPSNLGGPEVSTAQAVVSAQKDLDTIEWLCHTCKKPVANGKGYVHVHDNACSEVRQARRAWKKDLREKQKKSELGSWEAISLDDLMKLPDRVPWEVHHRKCDPNPGRPGYWIGVERIRTYAQMLNWTAHLMSRNWLKDTNWRELISRKTSHIDP